MIERLKLYEVADLEEVIAEGSKGFASPSMWVSKLLASFATIVRRRPRSPIARSARSGER